MIDFNTSEPEPEIEDDQEASTYLSIGDLMSGLLMFFALLFITALLQLQQAKEELVKQRRFVVGTLIEKLGGNNLKVQVNEATGDVSVRDAILFDEGSAELKPAGQAFLRQFIPIYSEVIFSKADFEKQITRVVIEGHTSSNGSYQDNLELSLLRSLSVARYIFSDNIKFGAKQALSQKILASGRGEIDAKPQDEPGDRKVVFRFQFRGEEFSDSSRLKPSLQDKFQ